MVEYQHNIDITLDDIVNRPRWVNALPKAVERGVINGKKEMTQRTKDKLIQNMSKYGLSSEMLAAQIDVDTTDDGISVSMDGEYVMFVEYGTGIVGLRDPHPQPSAVGWSYDTNSHGDSGWLYPSHPSDPNPTRHTNKDGEWVAWTKGVPSRPFMYETWLWASQSFNNVITKHINREIKKVVKR